MPRVKRMGRPKGASKGGAKDIWAGGYMIDCITCHNDPRKRDECLLCKGAGVIKVRE
jgi:hypothetical protein